jgi:hypothetical protein
MRIYEYEAKELFKEVGIAVPMSKLAQTPEHVREAAKKLNSPVILKPQTMLKARGKGGLIVSANNPEDAAEASKSIFGREYDGEIIDTILVEEMVDQRCVGGDRIVGLRFEEALRLFEKDGQTKGVLLIGEIGGSMEEEAAEAIREGLVQKPVFAYLAGYTAPEGTKVGHAGAIVQGSRGSMASKVQALESAGVMVAREPADVVTIAKKALER